MVLRFQLPHAALALLHRVDRSTITRAVHEVRPLLAARGFAVPARERTAPAHIGRCLRLRRYPRGGTAYRRHRGACPAPEGEPARQPGIRFGQERQNTKKAAVITDGAGHTLRTGAVRPGRMHDQTAVMSEGIEDLFAHYLQLKPNVATTNPRSLRRYFRTRLTRVTGCVVGGEGFEGFGHSRVGWGVLIRVVDGCIHFCMASSRGRDLGE
ncbi:hypothetical protein [Streptomyces sp. NPDC055085]